MQQQRMGVLIDLRMSSGPWQKALGVSILTPWSVELTCYSSYRLRFRSVFKDFIQVRASLFSRFFLFFFLLLNRCSGSANLQLWSTNVALLRSPVIYSLISSCRHLQHHNQPSPLPAAHLLIWHSSTSLHLALLTTFCSSSILNL